MTVGKCLPGNSYDYKYSPPGFTLLFTNRPALLCADLHMLWGVFSYLLKMATFESFLQNDDSIQYDIQ